MAQKIKFDKNNLPQLKELEWLETNGLGGWAMGSLSTINTRKYHSWLAASFNPPTDRQVVIPKLSENLTLGDVYCSLDANQYGEELHPNGWNYLHSFERELYPKWSFKTELGVLTRSLLMPNGKNTTLVKYEFDGEQEVSFHLRPFHVFRDIHGLNKDGGYLFNYHPIDNGVEIEDKATGNKCRVQVSVPTQVNMHEHIHENMTYSKERDRGYDYTEKWATLGYLDLKIKAGDQVYVVLSTESTEVSNAATLFEAEVARRISLVKDVKSDFEKQLRIAADQFIVDRGESKSIIAGYPWFTDWGRDTMISLEGLTLVTGRYDDALGILEAFRQVLVEGLIPNRFVEVGSDPEYNAIDATLWYVVAIYQYKKYSGRSIDTFLPAIRSIIDWHIKGTKYGIKLAEDGLLSGGVEGWQLTWMDAKLDGHVVTPRRGKAVEINALWFNVLQIADELSKEFDFGLNAKALAAKCKKAFNQEFIKPNGALYDVIDLEGKKDDSIRPNQAFAGSLPFKIISRDTAKAVVAELEKHLLTPHGMRSLTGSDPGFRGSCRGDLHSRDYAYHQGTVWMWLWGSYASTKLYVDQIEGEKAVKKQLRAIEKHFYQNGIGSLSEVFDGEKPHLAGGCPAQAWSVAEVLRVIHELKT